MTEHLKWVDLTDRSQGSTCSDGFDLFPAAAQSSGKRGKAEDAPPVLNLQCSLGCRHREFLCQTFPSLEQKHQEFLCQTFPSPKLKPVSAAAQCRDRLKEVGAPSKG